MLRIIQLLLVLAGMGFAGYALGIGLAPPSGMANPGAVGMGSFVVGVVLFVVGMGLDVESKNSRGGGGTTVSESGWDHYGRPLIIGVIASVIGGLILAALLK